MQHRRRNGKSFKILEERFGNNGFTSIKKTESKKSKAKINGKINSWNKTFLKLKFLNDSTNRQIHSLLKKYKIPANLVSVPNKSLYNCLKVIDQKNEKHDNCEPCEMLPKRLNCNDRFLIYKFTCKSCDQSYIGQTSRSFKHRFSEHKRAILKQQNTSALAEHNHNGPKNSSIQDFNLEILDRCNDPLDTRLTEARFIKRLRPKINRKEEMTAF